MQISITVQSLLTAGCTIKQNMFRSDEAHQILEVVFPTQIPQTVFFFLDTDNASTNLLVATADYNPGSATRNILESLIVEFDIAHGINEN